MLGSQPQACTQETASGFSVLAMGDLKSSAARKNLLGAIDIYKRAFPKVDPTTRLILKVQSDDSHPEFRSAANAMASGRGDIFVRAEKLRDGEVSQLIASSSVLLSPHRSEGFGLTLAEAFLAGVPALATGWSGNLDFMSDVPELLIRHTLVPVRDPSGIYCAPGQRWADPDLDDAAAKLRSLANSPSLRRALAERGKTAVDALSAPWTRDALLTTAIGKYLEGAHSSMHTGSC